MLTTLNKLEYLDETKQQIKNALNTKFNSQIQDTDTFRSYVSKISNIYTNWPKVTSENISLSLTPTKKGLMALNLKGNTSQSGTPTPETPQDIHVVSGDNEIVVTGKNLLPNLLVQGTWNTTSNLTRVANYSNIYLKAGTYTFSSNIDITKYKVWLGTGTVKFPQLNWSYVNEIQNWSQIREKKFTITTNSYFLVMYCKVDASNITPDELNGLEQQLEKGSIATDYKPCIGKSYTIYLGDIELCKIGDYQDYIYKDNGSWYLHKEINKVVLDGTEGWAIRNQGDGSTTISFNHNVSSIGAMNLYSDRFSQSSGSTDGIEGIGIPSQLTQIYIQIKRSRLSNLDSQGISTWLSNNNTTLYYILATPTYTEITDSTLISQLEALKIATSYDTQTNIIQTNNDLPFIISASALMKGSE